MVVGEQVERESDARPEADSEFDPELNELIKQTEYATPVRVQKIKLVLTPQFTLHVRSQRVILQKLST